MQVKVTETQALREILQSQDREWDRTKKQGAFTKYFLMYLGFVLNLVLPCLVLILIFISSLYNISLLGAIGFMASLIILLTYSTNFWRESYFLVGFGTMVLLSLAYFADLFVYIIH